MPIGGWWEAPQDVLREVCCLPARDSHMFEHFSATYKTGCFTDDKSVVKQPAFWVFVMYRYLME